MIALEESRRLLNPDSRNVVGIFRMNLLVWLKRIPEA